ncbi:MAG TPA: PorV/PorQ family protein [Bacteroidota bacterium]|nr:PorV/PorQ family protein [Bacteroidota bacterium]
MRIPVKNYRLVLLCAFPVLISAASAQYDGTYPFNASIDPRSAAMGESFVAAPANPAALTYNPAGLAGLEGMTLSYARKSLAWLEPDFGIASMTAAARTSFGVFAAQYNRMSFGSIHVTTAQSPDWTGGEITIYSYNLALGYAYRLPMGLALGASVKYYDFVQDYSGPPQFATPRLTTTPSYLFDFGLTYTLPTLHSQTSVEDSLTVGLAYQNMGTRWKYTIPSSIYLSPGAGSTEYVVLPEYFRIGFSYAMKLRPPVEESLSPFGAEVTGEFRTLLSPLPASYAQDPYTSPFPETSYWGIGLEFSLYEIFSVRGGAAFKANPTFGEGVRDKASFRYGAGLRLPLRQIGTDVPITFSFNYTVIPVTEEGFLDVADRSGTNPLFSLEIQYAGVPW